MKTVNYVDGFQIGSALSKVGLLPAEAVNVEILIRGDEPIRIRYEINVQDSDLPKLAEAFALLNHEVNK